MKSVIPEELLLRPRLEPARWIWDLLELYEGLDSDAQEDFWNETANTMIDGKRAFSVAERALLFWCVWTTLRPWDVSRQMSVSLSLVFQWIQNDCRTSDDREGVFRVGRACPYLHELQGADENWTEFRLPVEGPN